MPRMDGTGPEGRGPMTGGGRGVCNPNSPVAAVGSRANLATRPLWLGRFRTLFGRRGGRRGRGGGRMW
jgi:hypothetical protein